MGSPHRESSAEYRFASHAPTRKLSTGNRYFWHVWVNTPCVHGSCRPVRRAMGDGRWAMGDGRWAMGDGPASPHRASTASIPKGSPQMPCYQLGDFVPVVAADAYVHPTATLIGDVRVAARCYVGPGAVLRGDM